MSQFNMNICHNTHQELQSNNLQNYSDKYPSCPSLAMDQCFQDTTTLQNINVVLYKNNGSQLKQKINECQDNTNQTNQFKTYHNNQMFKNVENNSLFPTPRCQFTTKIFQKVKNQISQTFQETKQSNHSRKKSFQIKNLGNGNKKKNQQKMMKIKLKTQPAYQFNNQSSLDVEESSINILKHTFNDEKKISKNLTLNIHSRQENSQNITTQNTIRTVNNKIVPLSLMLSSPKNSSFAVKTQFSSFNGTRKGINLSSMNNLPTLQDQCLQSLIHNNKQIQNQKRQIDTQRIQRNSNNEEDQQLYNLKSISKIGLNTTPKNSKKLSLAFLNSKKTQQRTIKNGKHLLEINENSLTMNKSLSSLVICDNTNDSIYYWSKQYQEKDNIQELKYSHYDYSQSSQQSSLNLKNNANKCIKDLKKIKSPKITLNHKQIRHQRSQSEFAFQNKVQENSFQTSEKMNQNDGFIKKKNITFVKRDRKRTFSTFQIKNLDTSKGMNQFESNQIQNEKFKNQIKNININKIPPSLSKKIKSKNAFNLNLNNNIEKCVPTADKVNEACRLQIFAKIVDDSHDNSINMLNACNQNQTNNYLFDSIKFQLSQEQNNHSVQNPYQRLSEQLSQDSNDSNDQFFYVDQFGNRTHNNQIMIKQHSKMSQQDKSENQVRTITSYGQFSSKSSRSSDKNSVILCRTGCFGQEENHTNLNHSQISESRVSQQLKKDPILIEQDLENKEKVLQKQQKTQILSDQKEQITKKLNVCSSPAVNLKQKQNYQSEAALKPSVSPILNKKQQKQNPLLQKQTWKHINDCQTIVSQSNLTLKDAQFIQYSMKELKFQSQSHRKMTKNNVSSHEISNMMIVRIEESQIRLRQNNQFIEIPNTQIKSLSEESYCQSRSYLAKQINSGILVTITEISLLEEQQQNKLKNEQKLKWIHKQTKQSHELIKQNKSLFMEIYQKILNQNHFLIVKQPFITTLTKNIEQKTKQILKYHLTRVNLQDQENRFGFQKLKQGCNFKSCSSLLINQFQESNQKEALQISHSIKSLQSLNTQNTCNSYNDYQINISKHPLAKKFMRKVLNEVEQILEVKINIENIFIQIQDIVECSGGKYKILNQFKQYKNKQISQNKNDCSTQIEKQMQIASILDKLQNKINIQFQKSAKRLVNYHKQ